MKELFNQGILILKRGIDSVKPHNLFRDRISLKGKILKINGNFFDLGQYRKIWILGAGKASLSMGRALLEILKEMVEGGLICGNKEEKIEGLYTFSGSHPLPDERSYRASLEMEMFIREKFDKEDICIFLLSGGASSLLCYPDFGVTLEEKSALHKALINCGASIEEINIVRKHFSRFKGGKLARIIPCKVINLVLSDVPGDQMESIGSGPLSRDPSTWADVKNVFEKYGLFDKVPSKISNLVEDGISGKLEETLKEDPENLISFIIGNNLYVLEKAKEKAMEFGFSPLILTSRDGGKAKDLAQFYSKILMETVNSNYPIRKPCCILAGGEAQVEVKGKGKGGRNQEFILSLLMEMKGISYPFLAMSVDSDGIDGPTDASGAWIDNETSSKALSMGLEAEKFLVENDSYTFFSKTGNLIKFGETQTNVSDVRIFLIP